MSKLTKIEVPKLYTTDGQEDPIVKIHFYNPNGRGDWFVTEGQMECDGDWLFFGFVRSPLVPEYDELGYFTLKELQNAGIVKDTEWNSKPLSEAKKDALKVEALEAIILDTIGAAGPFVHMLCIGAASIVTIGEAKDPDTHIRGTYEDEVLWIEKVGLTRLWDLVSQLM